MTQVLSDQLAILVQPVIPVQQEILALQGTPDQPVHKEFRAKLALPETQVLSDLPEIWVLQALQGLQEPLGTLVLPETLDR